MARSGETVLLARVKNPRPQLMMLFNEALAIGLIAIARFAML